MWLPSKNIRWKAKKPTISVTDHGLNSGKEFKPVCLINLSDAQLGRKQFAFRFTLHKMAISCQPNHTDRPLDHGVISYIMRPQVV